MNKSPVYTLTAAVLGTLLVIIPLFIVPAADLGHFEKAVPQSLPERMKNLELYGDRGTLIPCVTCETPVQSYFAELWILALSLAIALAVYFVVRAKFLH